MLVVLASAMASCGGDEPSQADEFCKAGCTIFQDCAEEQFQEEFRDLPECIETCRENFQDNYDHDLAIYIEDHGPGAKRCLDLEVDYTICFDKNATCGEWNESNTPRECYDIADKTIACWDELEDGGPTDTGSKDDTDSATGGQCNTQAVAVCEEQFTECFEQGKANCIENFCQCLDATGCETYESCMEENA
jgi:hypothetical protein